MNLPPRVKCERTVRVKKYATHTERERGEQKKHMRKAVIDGID